MKHIKLFEAFEDDDLFSKWFGDSKVVQNDEPLVCYHGTRSVFTKFKASKSVGNQGETDQIEGMYFTDNADGASFYSLSDDDKYLMPVYLSIKNPYIVDNYKTLRADLGVEKLSDVNRTLKKLGYDGIIMESGFYSSGGPYRLFLTFEPNQIKSVNNDGSWDVDDDDIYS